MQLSFGEELLGIVVMASVFTITLQALLVYYITLYNIIILLLANVALICVVSEHDFPFY